MNCFVCGGETDFFLEKNFGMKNLDRCEYVRCENCGLVVAKTIYEMPHEKWSEHNFECHSKLFGGEVNYADIDPNVFTRFEFKSNLFAELVRRGIFKSDWRAVDYGAGDGFLADKTNKKIGSAWLKKFDAYMPPEGENYLSPEEVQPESFDFLLTCSVFEHLLGNQGDVEKIIGLIKPGGIMGLHTLICEEVPPDPNWFYFSPVHCTFWTNKSMATAYKKFNFKRCLYHVESRMWLMFREVEIFEEIKSCAEELEGTFVFSEDFVDYWKVKVPVFPKKNL